MSNSDHAASDYTNELVHRYVDGLANDAEIEELSHLMKSDPDVADLFVRISRLEIFLEDRYGQRRQEEAVVRFLDDLFINTESVGVMLEEEEIVAQREAAEKARIESIAAKKLSAFRREQDRQRRPESVVIPRNVFYTTASSLAAAAILLIFLALPDPIPVAPIPVFVASIDDAIDARWSDPNLSTASGTKLFTLGNLVLTRGVVRIAFEGGAKMVVEAPATLELLSPDSARLVWGRLVGSVPRSEVQLTIQTPNASIVDLGTEFGVEVNRQQVTHLHVFEGRVSATTLDAKGKTALQRTVLVDEAVYLQPKTGA
ncbi:MAG: FecR domain-containing protein, partial [Planctomycetes bacterium]|nr:FecR domain-containing protein [Planctomycetota bacterium]